MMVNATQIRNGMVLKIDNDLYRVTQADHRTPGNLRAMMQVILKRISDGLKTEKRFGASERVDKVNVEKRRMQFLYADGDSFHFMDSENYEQMELNRDFIEDAAYFLLPNTDVQIDMYEGRAVNIDLPGTVNLKVTETEPGLKGATQSGSYKSATLETGLVVQVPQFIDIGEVITIDTMEKKYIERAK